MTNVLARLRKKHADNKLRKIDSDLRKELTQAPWLYAWEIPEES